MLATRHIATLAAASIAWGLFAVSMGTSELDQASPEMLQVQSPGAPILYASQARPHSRIAGTPAPLGPIAFDDSKGSVASEHSGAEGIAIEAAANNAVPVLVEAIAPSDSVVDTEEADLSLSVGFLPLLAPDETGTISLTLHNEGPGTATTVLVAYDLPLGVVLSEAGPNGCMSVDGQALCWVTPTLEAGDETTVSIPVAIAADLASDQTISDGWAGIAASETPDSNSTNDSVSIAPQLAASDPVDTDSLETTNS